MPESSAQSLAEAFSQALETMAFVSPLPWEGDTPPAPAEPVIASICCRGEHACVIELMSDAAFGASVAANLFEPGSAIATNQIDDALREIMNVSAGLVMRGLATGGAGALALDVPSVTRDATPDQWASIVNDRKSFVFDADGLPVAVRLRKVA